jgi:hypothetical protein
MENFGMQISSGELGSYKIIPLELVFQELIQLVRILFQVAQNLKRATEKGTETSPPRTPVPNQATTPLAAGGTIAKPRLNQRRS